MKIENINPATGAANESFEAHTDGAVDAAVARAVQAFEAGRDTPFEQRADRLMKVADLLEQRKSTLAGYVTREMGKTLASAESEIEKCAWVCRFYAEHAAEFLADRALPSDAARALVRYRPLGPVLAVMPWNFPFWQVFRFAAPALMAGNTGLLKHASNVPRCAVEIERLFVDGGFDPGAFQTLLIESGRVERLVMDGAIKAATLTGSEGAGAAVAAACGQAIKKSVLELGGSDPFIVMPSADLEAAVDNAVKSRTLNAGQSCIAAKRFIVHADVYDEFRDRMVARFEALEVGDPMAAGNDVGPLALASIRDEICRQVDATLDAGARRLCGAEPLDGPGFFYRPGVVEDIPLDSPLASEETFGPVAALFRVNDFDAAIELANATEFGLGSTIFTLDEGEQARAVDAIEAGCTFVNAMVASDPRLPFGGIKTSGYGRELAAEGIREFVNLKTVSIN